MESKPWSKIKYPQQTWKKVGEEKNVDREIRFCRSIDFIKLSLSVSHPQKLASFFSKLASRKKDFFSRLLLMKHEIHITFGKYIIRPNDGERGSEWKCKSSLAGAASAEAENGDWKIERLEISHFRRHWRRHANTLRQRRLFRREWASVYRGRCWEVSSPYGACTPTLWYLASAIATPSWRVWRGSESRATKSKRN